MVRRSLHDSGVGGSARDTRVSSPLLVRRILRNGRLHPSPSPLGSRPWLERCPRGTAPLFSLDRVFSKGDDFLTVLVSGKIGRHDSLPGAGDAGRPCRHFFSSITRAGAIDDQGTRSEPAQGQDQNRRKADLRPSFRNPPVPVLCGCARLHQRQDG